MRPLSLYKNIWRTEYRKVCFDVKSKQLSYFHLRLINETLWQYDYLDVILQRESEKDTVNASILRKIRAMYDPRVSFGQS
jgi:hypothetical protein